MKLRGLAPNSYIHVYVSDLYITQDWSAYLAEAKQADRSWEYINRSQIQYLHECGNWETEHVLEITRPCSFHFWEYLKSEPVIYISHRAFICSV